jgi:hypothetical protein
LIGNTSNGFKIGHTDESCTKGVWMWSQPITINTKNGPANLLLFDTEVYIIIYKIFEIFFHLTYIKRAWNQMNQIKNGIQIYFWLA